MSRENWRTGSGWSTGGLFQSAPGSMSRENSHWRMPTMEACWFQSAPGSMSRENLELQVRLVFSTGFNPLPAR